MRRGQSAFLLILLAACLAIGQERYVRPIDEANLDPSFLAFRTKLIAAAERRDGKFIYGILDPKIQLSFGGHEGVTGFKEMWNIEGGDSKFWDELLEVVKNGGAFYRENGKRTGRFLAPYTFVSFPDDLDPFDHSMIFGNGVNLRERPDANSPIVAKLSYNVVTVDNGAVVNKPNTEDPDWYRLETLGGLKGFVKAEFVRSSLDYRAGFVKKRGQWKMVFFIAGD